MYRRGSALLNTHQLHRLHCVPKVRPPNPALPPSATKTFFLRRRETWIPRPRPATKFKQRDWLAWLVGLVGWLDGWLVGWIHDCQLIVLDRAGWVVWLAGDERESWKRERASKPDRWTKTHERSCHSTAPCQQLSLCPKRSL